MSPTRVGRKTKVMAHVPTRTVELVASLVLAAWLDLFITVEWSYPFSRASE